jgi:hypothetical protein
MRFESLAATILQSADTGGNRNQVHPLRSPVPSVCGKAKRHHSTRVFGSHLVLDDGGSRKRVARFPDLLQQPSHAYLTGRANAGYAVSQPIANPRSFRWQPHCRAPSINGGCLISQRFVLAAVFGRPLQKPRMRSSGVRVLSCSAFRGSDRFLAAVSIRQRQVSLVHYYCDRRRVAGAT